MTTAQSSDRLRKLHSSQTVLNNFNAYWRFLAPWKLRSHALTDEDRDIIRAKKPILPQFAREIRATGGQIRESFAQSDLSGDTSLWLDGEITKLLNVKPLKRSAFAKRHPDLKECLGPGDGVSLGSYRLLQQLSDSETAGMGIVYKSQANQFDGTEYYQAIKLPCFQFENIETVSERNALTKLRKDQFQHECRLHGQTKGESFVSGVLGTEPTPHLVMDLINGPTLDELFTHFDGIPFPIPFALDLCAQIAFGLDKLHQQFIAHFDLKPANILLATSQDHLHEWSVKICDFGLSINVRDKLPLWYETAQPGLGNGSRFYMSPQQIDLKDFSTSCDMFVLGILLYQMLSGAHPFERITNELVELDLTFTVQKPPLDPNESRFHDLNKFVFELLSKRPINPARPSAADAIQKLKNFQHTFRYDDQSPSSTSAHRFLSDTSSQKFEPRIHQAPLDKLIEKATDCLWGDSKAIGLLHRELTAENVTNSTLPSSRAECRDAIQQFCRIGTDRALNIMVTAYRQAVELGKSPSAAIAQSLERFCYCFLPAVFRSDDIARLQTEVASGSLISLPAQFPQTIEILMAAMDTRPVLFHRPQNTRTPPSGQLSISLPTELGLDIDGNGFIQSFRSNLKDRFIPMADGLSEEVVDEMIRVKIKNAIRHENHRFYYVYRLPREPDLQTRRRNQILDVNGRYPGLAFVEMESSQAAVEESNVWDLFLRILCLSAGVPWNP